MKLKFISILFMLGFVCVSMAKAEELMLETVEVTAQRLPLSAYGLNVSVPDPDEVGSSLYKSINHAVRVALQHDNHLFELKLGLQDTPYQGFPNQRMDMTDNEGKHAILAYNGKYQWGSLEAHAFHENTRHKINFLDEKLQK